MIVEMTEFKSVCEPQSLESGGLGPCIGVAIIYGDWGCMLHTPDVTTHGENTVDLFVQEIKSNIPLAARSTVTPVLAGGALCDYYGTSDDIDIQNETIASKKGIVCRLKGLGFFCLNTRWANPDETQELLLNLQSGTIHRKTWQNGNLVTDGDENIQCW